MTARLLWRVAREKRAWLVPLVAALVVNGLVTALVVLPLSARVGRIEQDEAAALAARQVAQREHDAARATLEHKQRAETDLGRFYTAVLPTSLSGARRQTYLRLAQLAADADLQYQRRLEEVQPPRDSGAGPAPQLTRFEITMVLRGEYDSVRQFIHDVEASEEFVAIDNVSLSEGAEPGSPLVLTLVMSTYYRTGPDGR